MKLGLLNYAVIPINNSYIKFNNNKINSLLTYDIAQNDRILHKVVQLLSQHNLKMSNHSHIQKLQKENNDSNKACRFVHDLSVYKTSYGYVQRFMTSLHKIKYVFKLSTFEPIGRFL
jgi:hypothetical protein